MGAAMAPGQAMPPRQRGGDLERRFLEANVTHDGRLTLAQARAAGMRRVARHFAAIDTQHRGYVTLPEIRAWAMAHRRMRTGGAGATTMPSPSMPSPTMPSPTPEPSPAMPQ
jgi:hypothetical protein